MLAVVINMLLTAVFGLFGFALMTRIWLNLIRVRAPVGLAIFLTQLTDWIIKPLRKIIKQPTRIDWPCLLVACIFAFGLAFLQNLLLGPFFFSITALLQFALLILIQWIIYIFTISLIAEAILSWTSSYSPMMSFLRSFNEPLLKPIRRIIPLLGMVDLSPLVAFLLLRIALYVAQGLLTPLAL